jgi:ribonuclease Z
MDDDLTILFVLSFVNGFSSLFSTFHKGMLFTMADGGVKNLSISGPTGLLSLMGSLRSFMHRPDLQVQLNEFHDERQPHQSITYNNHLKVLPVVLYDESEKNDTRPTKATSTNTPEEDKMSDGAESMEVVVDTELASQKQPSSSDEQQPKREQPSSSSESTSKLQLPFRKYRKDLHSQKDIPPPTIVNDSITSASNTTTIQMSAFTLRALHDLTAQSTIASTSNRTLRNSQTVCYICQGPSVPGKFSVEKALALGLEKGPTFGRLQRGESVMSEKLNRIVNSSEVVGPTQVSDFFSMPLNGQI